MRRISLTRRSKRTLHIEAPGCIINITVHLHDAAGNSVTHVSVRADGDRYAGSRAWWVDGQNGEEAAVIRVIEDPVS